ncbi:hypothetical protein HPP92_016738 [Vanilla planifolia]|uniref:Secreted protein n=1 Tax=Vanilla planifolia TaxID=51239 RepID=A0A835USD3_VANPL|nr:hypothetical protein HPP92_016738 [Vanilla planifolia]
MLKILPAIIRPAVLAVALMRSSASGLASAASDPTVSPPKINSDPTLLQPRVVIYDCVCHLCHRGVKWVIKVDKDVKIRFCCLQSKAAEPYLLLCGVDRGGCAKKRMLFIEGPEGCYEGSTAALKVACTCHFHTQPWELCSSSLLRSGMLPTTILQVGDTGGSGSRMTAL